MEQATPVRARCSAHPGVAAVAFCEECGRALCLECAIPVRGEVLGSECVPARVPEASLDAHVPAVLPRRSAPDRVALAGLVLALLATVLPWTRFGTGSDLFGSWGVSPLRHATAVGPVAAVSLALLWRASRPARRFPVGVRIGIATVAALTIVVFALLSVLHPVPFTRPTPGPFLAMAGALVALLAWPAWRGLRPDLVKRPPA